jgi:hypothetical protein
MSVAGLVILHHPSVVGWVAVAAIGGSDGEDDPALPRWYLKSAHEVDQEPIRGLGCLRFVHEPCRLAFASQAHRSDVFLTMHLDPDTSRSLSRTSPRVGRRYRTCSEHYYTNDFRRQCPNINGG